MDSTERHRPWLIAVDTGGTFIDAVARDPQGNESRCKLLSSSTLRSSVVRVCGPKVEIATNWNTEDGFFQDFTASTLAGPSRKVAGWSASECVLDLDLPDVQIGDTLELTSQEEAPVLAARLLTGTPLHSRFPPMELRLSTTRGTNALLERKGAKVAFFTTRGFDDLLEIGDQRRRDLFALNHTAPEKLYQQSFGVDERIDADGNVLHPLDENQLRVAANRAIAAGCETAAVAFVNSYRNPHHEQVAASVLSSFGFSSVTLSSDLTRRIKLLPRAQTAVVDASLTPIIQRFVGNVVERIGTEQPIQVMSSAGALENASTFRAKDSLFSGPAGGVVGAAAVANALGIDKIITFDMGGTSTDVARWDGDYHYQNTQNIGDAEVVGTSMRIHTVAAGGGSICAVKPSGLRVGPESAGASPGPACYGLEGPLTLTDVNLLLDRLDPEKISIPLDSTASMRRLQELKNDMKLAGMEIPSEDTTLLLGLLDIAVEHMAEAIRSISIRQGYDAGDYALVAFGGAGPQHACSLAEKLGMRTVIVPETAGILSASGVASAKQEHFEDLPFLAPLHSISDLAVQVSQLEKVALTALGADAAITGRFAELRLAGQESALTVAFDMCDELEPAFRNAYLRLYGYPPPASKNVELVAIRVRASQVSDAIEAESFAIPDPHPPKIVQDAFSTLIIETGWHAAKGSRGSWKLLKTDNGSTGLSGSIQVQRRSAIESELFRNRFSGIAEQMGELLQRSAVSTNVKERLDYSCAILDADGDLVINAPHIPVHLGALGECVRRCTKVLPPQDGDVIITNHPGYGGSHLPDITIYAPLFHEGTLIAYCANRAHHSELGGIVPGSMPANAHCLEQEGIVIRPQPLIRNGVDHFDDLATLLLSGNHPTRAVSDNLADIHAQVASARNGLSALQSLCQSHGPTMVADHLRAMTSRTAALSRKLIRNLTDIDAKATERMDDGSQISVRVCKQGDHLIFDFEGTSAQHPGNLNATPAIVRSAVLYVLRLLVDEKIPLNEGLLHHVRIHLPPCFLSPEFPGDPHDCPAVVGGNVETSQRLVDTLIKALKLQACSQGTMNNVIFGNEHFGYYETLCGGSGAGPDYHGSHALHTHMTNTSITDVEVLEHRYPVRLDEFAIRHDSGGRGAYYGGNGAIRKYRFLAPVTLSLLTQHRSQGPFGVNGGEMGKPGTQTLISVDGSTQTLSSKTTLEAMPGDVLHVETPGGGGWGSA